jgi:chemotaxis protein methyltransferase CheR
MNTPWSSPAHEAIYRLVRARTGLVFPASRVTEAEAGIGRAMHKTRIADVPSYLQRLEAGAADLDELVAELTVTETYFFREPEQFEFLRSRVLPGLVQPGSSEPVARVWSAGCASGEEAYSLAILLDQAGFGDRTHVLATDISRKALAKARDASYRAWSFRGVDPRIVRRYFRSAGDLQVLEPRIRERVRIEQLNLALDTYPSLANGTWRMDLILCRNVFIYFDSAVVRAVARRLYDCLAPAGWLITGSSDPSINEEGLYESVVTPAGVFYRRGLQSPRMASAVPVELEPPRPSDPPVRPVREEYVAPLAAVATAANDPLAEATSAFERGAYTRAVELARKLPDIGAAVLCVRALANARGPGIAERAASDAALRHPLAPEIHLLHGVLLLDLHRYAAATQAVKRALYLDRTIAFGYFLLGVGLSRLGDFEGARRAFGNARDMCARHAPDEILAFSDGQRAGRFAEAVTAQLELLTGADPS